MVRTLSSPGGRVHRHQAQRVHPLLAAPDDLVALDREGRLSRRRIRRAAQEHLRPVGEERLEVLLVVPDGHHAAGLVAHQRLEHVEPAAPGGLHGRGDHPRPHRRLLVHAQAGDRGQAGRGLVPKRHVQQEVADGAQAEVGQSPGGRRAHSPQFPERPIEAGRVEGALAGRRENGAAETRPRGAMGRRKGSGAGLRPARHS